MTNKNSTEKSVINYFLINKSIKNDFIFLLILFIDEMKTEV